jgi:long-chain fatty acid transport protein
MKKSLRGVGLTLVIISLLVSSVFATNGYFAHGYGTHYKALAGAGTAFPLSSMAAAINPAGMAFVGKRVDIGMSMFAPSREYSIVGTPSGFPGTFGLAPGTVESGSSSFLVPSASANFSLPGGHNIGLTIYGNGGMNTDYDNPTFGVSPVGVNLMQLFAGVTYARKITDKHAIGVTGIFSLQRFEAKGLGAFGQFSSDPTKLSDNGVSSSNGLGARIGYYGEWLPILSVGASYQTKISMGEFDEYAGLYAEQGGFDIPATWNVGVAVKALSMLTITADVQQIMYSDIKSIANPLLPNLMSSPLGNENAAGFGWEDMTVFKVGAQLSLIPGFTLRAGYSTSEQPVPESEVLFNILAPGVINDHVTFGLTKTILPMVNLNVSVMRALSNSVIGANPLEAPGQQTIEIKMDQWDIEAGVSISL